MSRPVIEVENLSKRYRLGAIGATSLREEASRYWDRLRGKPHPDSHDFWALRDVSFSVQPGEVVGVIGRNGAGKSTLLKILSRITEPTSGRAILRGRVASLLEVGTGFHPELTGRENIFLNGAILGMSRAEVRAKLDEIIAFAEVEKFIDTPVKRYSSGMYVRLAFAVAAHLEPEILIVDEVLAVGDAQFQKKCLGKINEVAHERGRTVMFVSHNTGVIANLCSHVMLMVGGNLTCAAAPAEVLAAYFETDAHAAAERKWAREDKTASSGRFRLTAARAISEDKITKDVRIDREVEIEFEFEVADGKKGTSSSIHLFDKQGVWVLCTGSQNRAVLEGRYQHRVTIPANFLNDGQYSIDILLISDVTHIEVHVRNALSFVVHETGVGREQYGGVINGCVRPQLPWMEVRLE